MSKEFIRPYAEMRGADNIVWTDAAMRFSGYSMLTAALMLVLAECGYALYHLSFLVR
jgi:hypothetical protein